MDSAGESPEIRFVRPIPGFGDLTGFVLVTVDGQRPVSLCTSPGTTSPDREGPGAIFELRSLERPEVRFLVAVPDAFFSDYDIELDDTTCLDLHLEDAADALVLVVLTVGADLSRTTANLMAPVVVNCRTREAAQVILAGGDWPVRAPVA